MRLVASGLHCHRGGRAVLTDLGFELKGGESLLVTGPNGAGKSTLLRALAGLVRLSAGAVSLHEGEPELTVAEQSHYLGHLDPLKPALTLTENLRFWINFLGGGAALPEHDALAAVGLAELADLPAAYLSAGQRRRLSLARLAAIRRPVWLLDEPTSTLDAGGQARFEHLARGHLTTGGLIVAATHASLGIEGTRELRLGGAA